MYNISSCVVCTAFRYKILEKISPCMIGIDFLECIAAKFVLNLTFLLACFE